MYVCMMDRRETPVYLRALVCLSFDTSGGWTWFAKHDGAIDRFELSCNEPSYCADLEEQKKK